VIELTAKRPDHDEQVQVAAGKAHAVLQSWQAGKTAA
jgi:hypothetical protein